MTGFSALIRLDGGPVAEGLSREAERALEGRGLSCREQRYSWAVATCRAPPATSEAGSTIVADARLDNRRDLIGALGLHPGLSDRDIILAAYRRWQDGCVNRLVGDFAFVIHDEARRTIFCARDHFGIRPFYYAFTGPWFAASTITRFLRSLPFVGDEIDEGGIADLLAGGYADGETTCHHGVSRLPPAHSMTVSPAGIRIARYWHPRDVPVEDRRDAAEGFLSRFADAVARRGAHGDGVGVMLSGGLDSSAIASQARRGLAGTGRRMPSFSMMLDGVPGWNERPFIQSVLDQGGFDPLFVDTADHDPVAELPALLDEQEGPFVAYNASLSRRVYRRARSAGLSLLLDGHGGDEVVSHGFGRLNELAADGDWRTLWRESAGIAGLFGMDRWSVLSPYLSHNRYVRHARRRWAGAKGRFGIDGNRAPASSLMLVHPALAARTGLAERHGRPSLKQSARHSERDLHVEQLAAPQQGYAFEVLDRMAAAAGVAAAYPFYDLQLVQFCLSLPSRHKLNHGQPRYVLRQAMRGILPEAVRLRLDKYDFAPALAGALLRRSDLLADLIAAERSGLGRFVDMDVARRAFRRLLDEGLRIDGVSLFAIWRTLMLAVWLDRQAAGERGPTMGNDREEAA